MTQYGARGTEFETVVHVAKSRIKLHHWRDPTCASSTLAATGSPLRSLVQLVKPSQPG